MEEETAMERFQTTKPGVSFYVRPGSRSVSAIGEASKHKLPPSPPSTPIRTNPKKNDGIGINISVIASDMMAQEQCNPNLDLVRSSSDSAFQERIENFPPRDSCSVFTPLSLSSQARTPNLERFSQRPSELEMLMQMPVPKSNVSIVTPKSSSLVLGEVEYEPTLEVNMDTGRENLCRTPTSIHTHTQPVRNWMNCIKCCFKIGTESTSGSDFDDDCQARSMRMEARTLWSLRLVRYEQARQRRAARNSTMTRTPAVDYDRTK